MSIQYGPPPLSAIMADHDRGPEYALVQCSHEGCDEASRIDDSTHMSEVDLRAEFESRGWTISPTLCPKHAKAGDEHGNTVAHEGLDRCVCGCKYWEHDLCVDCGAHVSTIREEDQ